MKGELVERGTHCRGDPPSVGSDRNVLSAWLKHKSDPGPRRPAGWGKTGDRAGCLIHGHGLRPPRQCREVSFNTSLASHSKGG